MEGEKKPTSSSSSSFTSDLFGSKDSSASSSSAIFGSIFSSPSKEVLLLALKLPARPAQNKQPSSFYQNEKVQPCHLSSSIYYGGQDVYSFPQNNLNSTCPTFNKDNGEDDSGSASRGNWWQGSLYY
ncbi:unnamed protein product [Withania somnifera]